MRRDGRTGALTLAASSALLLALILLGSITGCGQPGGGGGTTVQTSGVEAGRPGLSTSVRLEYYDVTGRTSTELISSMEKNGPNGYWAYTDWYVNWEYPFASGPDGFATGPVRVQADVTIKLPRWDPPTGVSADLVARWDRMVTALRAHEEGHRDIGFSTGSKVLAVLEALPAYTSKEALELAANNAANAIVGDGQARDASYDASTDHGESQGAAL